MKLPIIFASLVLVATLPLASAHGIRRNSQVALDPNLSNTIPNLSGPRLYYNGSGPTPNETTYSPLPDPLPRLSQSQLADAFFEDIVAIVNGSDFASNCTKCLAGAEIMHLAAITQPVSVFVDILIRVCNKYKSAFTLHAPTCEAQFSGLGGTGPYHAQLLQKMSLATGDHAALCYSGFKVCPQPTTIAINETRYFSAKPASAEIAPPPSGRTINMLHLSDWHLDPRYDIGSEANCSQYLCCRSQSTNTKLQTGISNASVPASRFGYLYCDSPPDLALSTFSTMPQLFNMSGIAFSIFTGDIVSHDDDTQLSRAYVEYEETVTFQTFKAQLGGIPLYATLGNHDSLPEAYNTPDSYLNGSNAFSWNYQLLSSLWKDAGWIDSSAASYAAAHYGAYSYVTPQGLKVVSLNTDFWYQANIFNYANYTNPDSSGILEFLANELTASEKKGQRVYIIGHVPSGYDSRNALKNPSALFYSIVRRFAPTTIAGIFFGHTHEDQKLIYYDYAANSTLPNGLRNTTAVDYSKPLMVAYIGPSITPLTGLNAGYSRYAIDAKTFSVVDSQVYFANMSESLTWTTPKWQFEYDARAVYDPMGKWPKTAPMNATFWDGVAQQMASNFTLLARYNLLETKSSVVTKNCTSEACQRQKVCFIRSGSSALSAQNCGSGANGPF